MTIKWFRSAQTRKYGCCFISFSPNGSIRLSALLIAELGWEAVDRVKIGSEPGKIHIALPDDSDPPEMQVSVRLKKRHACISGIAAMKALDMQFPDLKRIFRDSLEISPRHLIVHLA